MSYPPQGVVTRGEVAASITDHAALPSVHHVPFESSNLKVDFETWEIPGWRIMGVTEGHAVAGILYCYPIFVPETTLYYKIGAGVKVLAEGALARLGIYNWDNGLPGSLNLDAGTIDVSTTGAKTITINHTLTRGYYFLAFVSDSNPRFWAPDLERSSACITGFGGDGVGSPMDYVSLDLAGQSAMVAGGFPDPAPAALKDGYESMEKAFVQLCTHL